MKIIEAARPRAVFFADTAQTKAIDAHGPKRASGTNSGVRRRPRGPGMWTMTA